ncbi:hypothetical protein [Photobacterium phosphoreum]|uniref:hypothetical protein n=1 Tax=Photobacterium phosphoreum TaxID=659 RepID=UPI0024B663D0|nr:hypothetical protein [Photobacterium phosphoreum]
MKKQKFITTSELKAHLQHVAKLSSLKQLRLEIEGLHGTEVKISRVAELLQVWISLKTYKHFEQTNSSELFVCLASIYGVSQLDGGKTRWRDKVTPISEGIVYRRADNSLQENKENLAPLFMLYQLLSDYEKGEKIDEFRHDDGLITPYIAKTQELELVAQDYLNAHQRQHHDFRNEHTLMDFGITEAIYDANAIMEKVLKQSGDSTNDSIIINTLKSLDLNRSRNDLMCLIQSAQENTKCDWFNGTKFITAFMAFNRLDSIESILSQSFDKKTPNDFMTVVCMMLSGYVQQRSVSTIRNKMKDKMEANQEIDVLQVALDVKAIDDYSFFNMAFVLMSLYVNKTKLEVKITGKNNHIRTVYTDINNMMLRIKNSQKEKKTFDLRLDLEEFVYDKMSVLESCEPEYCIETGNVELLEKGIRAYGNYRKTKFEYIKNIIDALFSHELNLVNELTDAFHTELASFQQ